MRLISTSQFLLELFINGLWLNFFCFAIGFFIRLIIPAKITNYIVRLRRFENEVINTRLGVREYKKQLIASWFGKLNKNIFIKGNKREGLDTLPQFMCIAELTHAWGLILSLAIAIGCCYWAGNWSLFLSITLLNIPINVYPVLLQRYNRLRIQNIVANT
jgi:hypothetical protein